MLACISRSEPAGWQPPWTQPLAHVPATVSFGVGWQLAQTLS